MVFFRSEEEVRRWSDQRGDPVQPLVTMQQLWQLAWRWYSNRLDATARRPVPAEMREIFADVGLDGPFWDPSADSWHSD
jgi:hypothetical protein